MAVLPVPGGAQRIYCYAGCSTCRKALRWLQDQAIAYEVVDITSAPPSLEELSQALASLGDRQRLFNTSGLSYRTLGSAQVKALTDAEALEALAADGKLIKRPFLITPGGEALTGFDPQRWSEALRQSAP
ncbi:Spx/MgsR family RNA polymerase-binding regulatory protein [Cyanobium sp. Morenito 9A2]|uniref:Spx/MgsR family RNA polymerase-binding regulatory protein n=1 Tax=Cyanobium sp. Morenito 9A2 TaxID=2823718 RepID=UPI0020CC1B83|nr:Spx/MgsR family RNA polymerase-binding regulatory protein [Cyanobium sp. Morenito 9A2]MCP9849332.1 Spx/MgsR family RNA polymerase-binding regulatory protein [Cyanobium sp. Morenito 9A2]